MERRYRSQTEYGEYGGLICTPVCCLVMTSFAQTSFGLPNWSDEVVHRAMVGGHALYQTRQKGSKVPMMFQELLHVFEEDGVKFSEAAGLTHTGERELVDSLLICPLADLLEELILKGSGGVIVTCLGHTVCYLMTQGRGLFLFDPLPARLVDVTRSWRETLPTTDVEYSALNIAWKP